MDNPVNIDVIGRDPAWTAQLPDAGKVARRAALAALANAGQPAGLDGHALELSVVLTDDAEVRRLNREFRRRDRPTNVLAFPAFDATDLQPRTAAPALLGDVVIGRETVTAEASAQDKPLSHHLAHLVVHGTLHLLGYDHANERDGSAMEGLETAILAGLGVPDPYRDSASRPSVTTVQPQQSGRPDDRR